MPGGSKICGHLGRITRRSRQRTYHDANSPANLGRSFCQLSSGQMSQAPLDPIARDRIPYSATDNKAHPGARKPPAIPLKSAIVGHMRAVNHERGPTYAYPAPGRSAEVLRAAHSQQSRQHGGRSTTVRRTAGCGPCDAGPRQWHGRRGSASADGSHGYGCDADCSVGTCACSRKNSQHLRSAQQSGTVLTRHASRAGRAAGSGRYGSDLLTVRGPAKPVKLVQTLADANLAGGNLGGLRNVSCERRQSRSAERRRSEPRRFSSASDDDASGFKARCASSWETRCERRQSRSAERSRLARRCPGRRSERTRFSSASG
jgi:hypothetical protein